RVISVGTALTAGLRRRGTGLARSRTPSNAVQPSFRLPSPFRLCRRYRRSKPASACVAEPHGLFGKLRRSLEGGIPLFREGARIPQKREPRTGFRRPGDKGLSLRGRAR